MKSIRHFWLENKKFELKEREIKGGTLLRVPFLFRGVLRGKRFMIEGGLMSFQVTLKVHLFSSKAARKIA